MKYPQNNDTSQPSEGKLPEMADIHERISSMNAMIDDCLKFVEAKLDGIMPEEQSPQPMPPQEIRPAPIGMVEAYRRQVEQIETTYERLCAINRRMSRLF